MPSLLRAPTREFITPVIDSHRWDRFVPRDGDIIICTYPKCGTTWTQRIVDLLVFQDPAPRPVMAISPWLDATFFATNEEDLALLAAQTHRRFIKTHMPFDAVPLFEGVKYIHTARDGRDACLSMHNHQLGFRQEMKQRIGEAARNNPRLKPGPPPVTPEEPRAFYLGWIGAAEAEGTAEPGGELSFFEFENTYWRERRRDNLLLVHYADMKADLEAEMRRIAKFLGIDVPEALMPALVKAATFDDMKKHGTELMPQAELAFDRGADRFLNKGTNGRWKDILSAEDIARYERLAARKWSAAERAWITGGRRVAGDPRLADD